MVQLQFQLIFMFLLELKDLMPLWFEMIIKGHHFRIPDHQFANEADFLRQQRGV